MRFCRHIATFHHTADSLWVKMFASCSGHDKDITTQLVEALETLLQRYKVQAPANLAELVSRGIPCTCHKASVVLPASPGFPLRKVSSVTS